MKSTMLRIIFGLLAIIQLASASYVQPDSYNFLPYSYQEQEEDRGFTESEVDRYQLDFYGSAGVAAIFDSTLAEAEWPYSVFGGEAWVNGLRSLNVFSVKAEGQVAYGEENEVVLTEAFAQHDWRHANGLGASLLVGQHRSLAKGWAPRAYEAALPRPMDTELPFTEGLSGGVLSVYWDKQTDNPIGFSVSGAFGARRTMPHQTSDTLLSAFPEPQGKWTGTYHISGYVEKLALHLSWEKQVGHNITMYAHLNPRLSFAGSWTYSFHPDNQLAPDNLYGVKGSWDVWVSEKHGISLASGLDFGEQKEAAQVFVGYNYNLPMNGLLEFQVGYDSRYEQPVAALRYYWRPE